MQCHFRHSLCRRPAMRREVSIVMKRNRAFSGLALLAGILLFAVAVTFWGRTQAPLVLSGRASGQAQWLAEAAVFESIYLQNKGKAPLQFRSVETVPTNTQVYGVAVVPARQSPTATTFYSGAPDQVAATGYESVRPASVTLSPQDGDGVSVSVAWNPSIPAVSPTLTVHYRYLLWRYTWTIQLRAPGESHIGPERSTQTLKS